MRTASLCERWARGARTTESEACSRGLRGGAIGQRGLRISRSAASTALARDPCCSGTTLPLGFIVFLWRRLSLQASGFRVGAPTPIDIIVPKFNIANSDSCSRRAALARSSQPVTPVVGAYIDLSALPNQFDCAKRHLCDRRDGAHSSRRQTSSASELNNNNHGAASNNIRPTCWIPLVCVAEWREKRRLESELLARMAAAAFSALATKLCLDPWLQITRSHCSCQLTSMRSRLVAAVAAS